MEILIRIHAYKLKGRVIYTNIWRLNFNSQEHQFKGREHQIKGREHQFERLVLYFKGKF